MVETPAAFVLGLYDTGLSAVRGLARHGVPVVGLDFEPANAGFASRYCRALECPHPEQAPEQLIALLFREARDWPGPSLLFPASDAFALFISRYRTVLDQCFRFTLPRSDVMEALVNKRLQYELAERVGIPYPPAYYPESPAAAARIASLIQYPAVIKPYYGHRFREQMSSDKAFRVESAAELRACFEKNFVESARAVAQPLVDGPPTNLVTGCYCWGHDGALLGSFMFRKLRQYPIDFGVGTFVENYFDATVDELGLRFCQAIEYRGIAEVEFKLDERDGEFKLIELNPRLGAQNELAVACGVNFAYALYLDAFGKQAPPVKATRRTKRWLDLKGDFFAFLDLSDAGTLHWLEWLRSIITARSFAAFALDDLGPFLKRHNYGLDYVRGIRTELGRLIGRQRRSSPRLTPRG